MSNGRISPGTSSSQGKKPTTPTVGSPSAGNQQVNVNASPPSYLGKSGFGYYLIQNNFGTNQTSSFGFPFVFTGLTNGTQYSFFIVFTTDYGIQAW